MSAFPEAAHAELRAVYARLEKALEPLRRHCCGRGLCCNFPATGHMLFVTDLEAAEMARAGLAPDRAQAEQGICPFQRGNLCGVREHRAIGCRLYYCDTTYDDERNALYERFLKEVREIETRHGIPTAYRPVTRVFLEPDA